MNSHENLKQVIDNINKGKKYPAVQLIKSDPAIAAIISKLVKPRDKSEFDIENKNTYYNINQSQIQDISETIKSRIVDNKNILQLFPDIELAIQIMVSSILSPKDMVKTELIYKTKETFLPSELTLKLNEIVKSHLESYYQIKDNLNEILRDILFNVGSYINIVLPESILDEVINNNRAISTESLSELQTNSLGILGNSGIDTRPVLESFLSDRLPINYNTKIKSDDDKINKALEGLVEITDNYKYLKLPKVAEAVSKSRIKNIISTESNRLSNTQLSNILYKQTKNKSEEFLVIPSKINAKRKNVGRPMVIRLPSESVIPVYIPGDETKHIGYFVLIDIDGNPVTLNSNLEHMQGLSSLAQNQNNQSLSSLLIQKAKNNLVSSQTTPTIDQITKVYASIVEKDLIERLKNGIYKQKLDLSNNNEVYRIMLARTLAGQYTRLVYVPEELITYFALNYYDNGVGKSYLDDIKVLTSLRAIILFSKVMALTKNSIALTHVNMTLDPNDPDPKKTIEVATHEIVKMRQQYFPLGINSPVDLVNWIQRAGFEFTFEGHPGLPQTKFDFETKNLQHAIPDNDLDELLRKQTYMAFGLNAEIVDNGFNAEFATTVISNNILLSKQVMQIQDRFTRQLTDLCQKIILNDPFIVDEIIDALKDNKGLVEKILTDEEREVYNQDELAFLKDILERYVDNISIDLPKPDITSQETQAEAFDHYVETLDKALDAWINSEFITNDLVGEIGSNIDSIKSVVKHYFIRQWMSENGFMPELNDIVTTNEDGKPSLDIYDVNKNHMEGLIRSSIRFIKSLQGIKVASDTDLENMNVEPGTSTDTSEDEFGMDDMSGMDETGDLGESNEEEVTDTTEEEPSATE